MKRSTITLDAKPVAVERLSATQFLELTKKNPGLIKSSRVVAPTPGRRGFGAFVVEYSRPIYKVV